MKPRLLRPLGRGLRVAIAVVMVGFFGACKDAPAPLAKLVEATTQVDRSKASGDWKAAAVGTGFFVGDAARTSDGFARLTIRGAGLKLDPHSIIRFGGKGNRQTIDVELGAFELEGAGDFGLSLGEVSLSSGGGVRVTAGENGNQTIELLLGDARYIDGAGKEVSLSLGEVLDLSLGEAVAIATIDGGVVDAAPEVVPVALTLEIKGPKAQVRPAADAAWDGVAAGAATLPVGGTLKLGSKTTAKANGAGLALELSSGSVVSAGGKTLANLESGNVRSSFEGAPGPRVSVPGATIGGANSSDSGASVEVLAKLTKVTANQGMLQIVGRAGKMTISRGESVTITPDGDIEVVYKVPDYYDLLLPVGSSATIHDPKGATAVRFALPASCSSGGSVDLAKGGTFAGARTSGGNGGANLMVPLGTWRYRLRCNVDGGDGPVVDSGTVTVRRDDGRRPIPKAAPTNRVDANGGKYNMVYQNIIPNVDFRWKGAPGSSFNLQLTSRKSTETISSNSATVTVPGSKLRDGTYTFYFERADGTSATSRTSSLSISFDNAAPTASIDQPSNGVAWGSSVLVKGVALPGWRATVEGKSLSVDSQGRFEGSVPAPSASALAIGLSHPQRGVHYYMRRPR